MGNGIRQQIRGGLTKTSSPEAESEDFPALHHNRNRHHRMEAEGFAAHSG